ncbi:family 10 glycosylhydrolase [Nibribacter ruber]|uniref:Family 10 glycosylhydrolase n=1 Tax=Nibribacter ruber TaxID=2698458 RepID=A0A6P1P1P6_9BACT|nr:family 10 glycosylhydrolase [Nibribacter ruber]QHL87602.1 family 10 glycosylhydrolase [Nibribacter ruber]
MKTSFLKLLCLLLAFFSVSSCSAKAEEEPAPAPVKKERFSGVWITNVASNALDSRENIRQAVALCEQYGINNIFMVVWNRGRTLYPSQVMQSTFGVRIADKFAGRDPLAEMIEEAHKKNIKVHAWFEYGFAASNNENGGLILQTKPEWAAKDASGNLLKKNGFEWMNAFHPEVQAFMTSLVTEVVSNYAVDGVQGDDRLPALPSTGGYDDYTVNLYKSQHNNATPPSNYKEAAWVTWRTNLLTDYLGSLYAAVKKIKPNVIVSTAPSIYPWAKEEYLQDWPVWLNKGYTDMVLPQHYRYDITAYQAVLKQQLSFLEPQHRSKFFPGVLIQNADYNPSPEFLSQMVAENRRQGITGESFWFFEGIKKFPEFFAAYKQQVAQ